MFGRVFFVLVMLAMFWIGRRWHDVGTPAGGHVDSVPAADLRIADWAPVPAAFLLLLLAPAYLSLSAAGAAAGLADARQLATLPAAATGWQGPVEDESAWRPSFQGAAVVRSGVYRGADQSPVDLFGAVYGLGPHADSEMISFGNDLVPQEGASLLDDHRRVVRLPGGGEIEVREALVPDAAGPRLVWQWFMVGDRVAVSPFHVKALEALALVTRSARDERVLTLATPDGDGASERLEAFFAAHAECLRGGLAPESCGG
jgi:EpsI family protein